MGDKVINPLIWAAMKVHYWMGHRLIVKISHGAVDARWTDATIPEKNEYVITQWQWQTARDQISGKPSWYGAPQWAEYLVQEPNGQWKWCEKKPAEKIDGWRYDSREPYRYKVASEGIVLGRWQETLEERPASSASSNSSGFITVTRLDEAQDGKQIPEGATHQHINSGTYVRRDAAGWWEHVENVGWCPITEPHHSRIQPVIDGDNNADKSRIKQLELEKSELQETLEKIQDAVGFHGDHGDLIEEIMILEAQASHANTPKKKHAMTPDYIKQANKLILQIEWLDKVLALLGSSSGSHHIDGVTFTKVRAGIEESINRQRLQLIQELATNYNVKAV